MIWVMKWQKLISDLRGVPMTQQQIADAIGVSQATVSELAAGKILVPSWDKGEALRRLHKKRCRASSVKQEA